MNYIKFLIVSIALTFCIFAQVNGFIEDFNDNDPLGWEVPETHLVTYEISETDSVFVILYHRTVNSGVWDVINYNPQIVADLSSNPYISVKVKSDIAVELVLKPRYENANTDWLEAQLPGDNTWHTYFFQIESDPPLLLTRMYVYLDGGSTVIKSGTVCLDNLSFGSFVDTTYVDVSDMETALTNAYLLYNNSNEGTDESEYVIGSKTELYSSISDAQAKLTSGGLTQADIEEATWDLYDACVTFESKVITESVGIIDSDATRETRYLYTNLKKIASDYMIFGMHDVTGYGVGWSGDDDRSDVKDVCGSYPAMYGEDMNKIARNVDVERVRYRVISAYNRGGITTFSWHQYDPEDRGFYDDDVNNENIVASILPGGKYHTNYKEKLYRIASFLKSLRGPNGENIPIIFRPYHEHTGGWFWWGAGDCTESQYIAIWQFTVTYLRDSLNVHNLLYALSPAGQYIVSKEDYYTIFPGADYIDIFGVDDYFTENIPESEKQTYLNMLKSCVEAANDNDKIVALTEMGQESLTTADFYTNVLLDIVKNDNVAINISYAMTWRNANEIHHFAPYPEHPSVPDFLKFYDDPFTLFEDNLPDMYHLSSIDTLAPTYISFPENSFIAVDTAVTITITTNEKAFLRYSLIDQSFNDMPNDFEKGQGTLYHSTTLFGRQGDTFQLYVRSMDYAGNMSSESMMIDFTIDTLQMPVHWFDERYSVHDWTYAPAPFVFQGEGNGTTEIRQVRTSYFKKNFTIEDASVQQQLIIFVRFDNGFIVYLNGHEVDRYSVPTGDLEYTDWGAVASASLITRTLNAEDCQYLVDGENWISVEIHQAKTDSLDHLFDLKMIAPTILIDYGENWYYYDNGQQPADRTIGDIDFISEDRFLLPDQATLYPNYPNPFNPSTTIRYSIPAEDFMTISVFDLKGFRVDNIISERQSAGVYSIQYNANKLSSGIYFLVLKTGQYVDTQKITILK